MWCCFTQDHTGQQWMTAFEEPAAKIIGLPANELKQKDGTAEFDRIIQVLIWHPHVPLVASELRFKRQWELQQPPALAPTVELYQIPNLRLPASSSACSEPRRRARGRETAPTASRGSRSLHCFICTVFCLRFCYVLFSTQCYYVLFCCTAFYSTERLTVGGQLSAAGVVGEGGGGELQQPQVVHV